MPSYQITPRVFFLDALTNGRPKAMAWITDNRTNPVTSGLVKFYQPSNGGVLIEAEIFGLPDSAPELSSGFFGMHIHDASSCSNSETAVIPGGPILPISGHYNPGRASHPFHAGDLPPILSNQGYAWMAFYDRRFTIDEIIGKILVLHSGADDFTSQPSGNSGSRLACGEIRKTY